MRRTMLPLALMATATPATAATPAETAIRSSMEASAAGWNAGDLARFMAVYADDAVFVTPKGLLRGKPAIADKYRSSFRGVGNVRGKLSFAFLEMRGLDPAHAILFARWTLTGATTSETGMTTLVFERRGAAWKIISDHSS
ncbi:MAG: SgcJ/EcaC family oxidoreductase [Sphingomonas sp.]|nr:MAG: SgcJ/EcaC family oxidoreductase [Sphingomonas sp.]